MAGAGGIEGLHAIDGTCDLCGEQCDSETQELNALTCTFAPNCPEVTFECELSIRFLHPKWFPNTVLLFCLHLDIRDAGLKRTNCLATPEFSLHHARLQQIALILT